MTRGDDEPGKTSGGPRPLAIEAFDPGPSIVAALELLEEAGVPYALAGRLAVWTWVAGDDQEFTKDVDFAVAADDIHELERVARQKGFKPLALSIGGFGIRQGDKRIDFIDRRVDFAALYAEAVASARDQKTVTYTSDGRAVTVTPAE